MRYFSMFSGIGGFEYGIDSAIKRVQAIREANSSRDLSLPLGRDKEGGLRATCVGFSEIDKYAIAIYRHHYPEHKNYGDAFKINPETIPNFDLLVGGFPCQAFSVAGKRGGFQDTRGTLFFEIARILFHKRPRHFLLENVKGLLSHDNGKTFQTILGVLSDLGYGVEWQVLNSKDFGVPQNRERVFIVGHLGGVGAGKVFPIGTDSEADYVLPTLTARYYGGQANGGYIGHKKIKKVNNPTHSNDRVYAEKGLSPALNTMQGGNRQPKVIKENFRVRRLTPTECERLQAFPDGWSRLGVFVPENKQGACAKKQVTALITDGKTKSVGFNYCCSPVPACPRLEGEGYEKCVSVCNQTAHAEINALRGFKGDKTKAMCYIHGHTRVCDSCKEALGCIPIVFGLPPEEISDSQRYKCLGNSVTTNVVATVVAGILK